MTQPKKQYYNIKDSGKRHEFGDGAVRDSRKGKGRFDLISPIALARLAGVYERGVPKYGERNWEKGMNVGRLLDSAIRHIYQHLEGLREEDHLGHAAFNLFTAMHTEEMIHRGLLDDKYYDLPDFVPFLERRETEVIHVEENVKPCSVCQGTGSVWEIVNEATKQKSKKTCTICDGIGTII